jgi:hypothetical protein
MQYTPEHFLQCPIARRSGESSLDKSKVKVQLYAFLKKFPHENKIIVFKQSDP